MLNIGNVPILRPLALPYAAIKFRSQTVLTTDEVSYGLTVVLALNGIAVLDDGDKFVQIVPIVQAARVKPNAPRPEKDSALIDPRMVPSFSLQIML